MPKDDTPRGSRPARRTQDAAPGRFRLTQYFTVTSLIAFAAVATALYFLERAERTFFEAVQREQTAFFAQAQAELVREQNAAARANLLMEHEAGHVTLATLSANALWNAHFAPLVAQAQRISIDPCRPAGGAPPPRSPEALKARQACFAQVGGRIRALPGFAAVDAAVHAMMKKSTVFKIKVYDLRGLTVYSSEHGQVGEDKAENLGWMSAVKGKAASELVHRDRFSAFEGEVENRDLIQSYVPVMTSAGDAVAGVFEIYSDVTPLLAHIDAVSAGIRDVAAANQGRIEAAALENRREVASNSNAHFAILAALLVVLYLGLLVLVRNAQRIIDEQQREREQAALREEQWHREKMAALATMAANASHEIGNPLAVISGLAEEIAAAQASGEPVGDRPRRIVEQAGHIAGMTRRITDFAAARSESPELVDVNEMVKAVCDFLSFDSRFRELHIEVRLADQLPACVGIPDHLNEVVTSLLQAHAESCIKAAGGGGRIVVETRPRGPDVAIRIGCQCPAGEACALPGADYRLESARRRMQGMGGGLVPLGATTEILLPSASEA